MLSSYFTLIHMKLQIIGTIHLKKIFFGAIIISSHLVLKALHFDKTSEFLKFIGDLKG